MKHPYVATLSVDHAGSAPRPMRHGQTDWHLYYEIRDGMALRMIGSCSLIPPHLFVTESEAHAKRIGMTVLESEYPKTEGWRNHRVITANVEDDFILYEYAHQDPYYESLRLYSVSAVVIVRFGSALANRHTIVSTCAGNSDSEAFAHFREISLDRAFPSEFRIGFAAKVRPILPETVRYWRKESMQFILAFA